MMKFVSATLAVLAMALTSAAPASAAWSCIGADYVCSKSGHVKAAKYKSAKAGYKSSKKYASTKSKSSKGKYAANASRKAGSIASTKYSGGGSTGLASYYWQGQRVASGGRFNPNALTAAHKTLPFGTRVLVTNLSNGRSVTVTINDRGPYIRGRVIDLSLRAAQVVGMTGAGVARVSYTVVGRG